MKLKIASARSVRDGRRELRRCFKAEIAVTCHKNSKRGEIQGISHGKLEKFNKSR